RMLTGGRFRHARRAVRGGAGGMKIPWKLRMAAPQREGWAATQLRRLLAERAGLEVSAAAGWGRTGGERLPAPGEAASMPDWLAENVDPAGSHYLRAVLWHRLAHRPEVSPHLRCELLQLLDGELASGGYLRMAGAPTLTHFCRTSGEQSPGRGRVVAPKC